MTDQYTGDPVNGQATDSLPPMEALPPRKPVPPPAVETPHELAVEPLPEAAMPVTTRYDAQEEESHTLPYIIGKVNDVLQWLAIVIEVMLIIRFLFKLIGADPNNAFAYLLYTLTDVVMFPFANIVPSPSLHPNQAFEFSALIAMGIYWLIFWAIRRFLHILVARPEEPID